MKLRVRWWWMGLALVLALGVLYHNRIYVLQHSLGWHTDWKHPRDPYRPIDWQSGPRQSEVTPDQRPPNIIVILADDMGINDVGIHGGGQGPQGVTTPHIDGLGQAGVSFDRGYAGSAICTVSRAALMTGRYPWRFGLEFTPLPGAMGFVLGNLYPPEPPMLLDKGLARQAKDFNELGMPASELTLAEMLKQKGYHNIHIGKWHLGSTSEMRPNNQGFDESLFMESGLYLPQNDPRVVNSKQNFDPVDNFLWPNMRFGVSYNGGRWFERNQYLTDYFSEEAVKAIRTNKHRPFFMYLAHWGVHTPLQASKADYDALSHISDHRQRVYAAMVRSVDRSVGRVMQTLREEGLDQNTLVVFTSDNGAPAYIGLPQVNKPYRGWKLTFFEGGLRVPFVAQWPQRISPGQRYTTPVHNIDITPTVLAAAGAALPSDRTIDGVNLLPFVARPSASATPASLHAKAPVVRSSQPERHLFWRAGPHRAVQSQGWKLISVHLPAKDWLFDLNTDPTERKDLALLRPDKLAELKALMTAHHANMPAPMWPSFLEGPIFIDKTLDQPHQEGDVFTYWVN